VLRALGATQPKSRPVRSRKAQAAARRS
jgi:hypothetical protein